MPGIVLVQHSLCSNRPRTGKTKLDTVSGPAMTLKVLMSSDDMILRRMKRLLSFEEGICNEGPYMEVEPTYYNRPPSPTQQIMP